MVHGAFRTRTMKRSMKRTPGGRTVKEYRAARPGKPTCPSGRPLPGTARGTKTEVQRLTKSQRRPSRPFGGVLSSPLMREVMRERAAEAWTGASAAAAKVFVPGTVCLKIAGRDAGKQCVVVEQLSAQIVKIDGFTRPRKCNIKHLEPTGKRVDIAKAKDSKAIQALLN